MGTVLLVRHGRTAWNDARRIQGWAPVGLTDRGREAARALGRRLAEDWTVDRVVASDLRRTVETARELRRAIDAPLHRDRRWRERDFGVLQGLSYEELFEGHPEFGLLQVGHAAADARPERGESWLDARERVLEAWDELRAEVREETVVVVTHGGPIRSVLGRELGLDVVASIAEFDVPNCSVAELEVGDGVEVVRRPDEDR